jgi:hypothetical protein
MTKEPLMTVDDPEPECTPCTPLATTLNCSDDQRSWISPEPGIERGRARRRYTPHQARDTTVVPTTERRKP